MESDVAVFHSPIGFENAEAWNNYMNQLENVVQEIPEKEREELKELIDEDFGLLELAINSGRAVKKTGILSIAHSIRNPEGHLGIKRITLIARMTQYQLQLVPIEWKRKYKVYQER